MCVCVIKFDSFMYVCKISSEWKKNSRHFLRHWGIDIVTQESVQLFRQTSLLTLDFWYDYKTALKTSCEVTLLPKQPGSPGKLDCHLQEINDNDPLRYKVQKKYSPIKRLQLWRFCPVPGSVRGGRQGTMLTTGLCSHPKYERSFPCHFWTRIFRGIESK
jgi:hypothetical protein